MTRNVLQGGKKLYASIITILFFVSLISGCLFSITWYDHPTHADKYTSIDVTVSAEADDSYTNVFYGVFAVLLPDSWSVESGSYSGHAVGSLTVSDAGAEMFERLLPSDSDYKWVALVTDQMPMVLSDASLTFNVTLKTGQQGHEWIDYRVIFVNTLAFGEDDTIGISFSPHIGNAYINVDAQHHLPDATTYVPYTDTAPSFGVIDASWTNAALIHNTPGRGGRFEFYTYLIADKTHLNIFIDAVGIDDIQSNNYLVLAFDTNNDNVLTPGIDLAIRIASDRYELVRYNGEFDFMRWNEVIDSTSMHDTMYVEGIPLPARTEWKATQHDPVPHATYSMRIPRIDGLIGTPRPGLRYAILLYRQHRADYNNTVQTEDITLDTRAYLPQSVDAHHMFTWGRLVFLSRSTPVNTWGMMYLFASQALDEANALWKHVTSDASIINNEEFFD